MENRPFGQHFEPYSGPLYPTDSSTTFDFGRHCQIEYLPRDFPKIPGIERYTSLKIEAFYPYTHPLRYGEVLAECARWVHANKEEQVQQRAAAGDVESLLELAIRYVNARPGNSCTNQRRE